MPPSNQKPHIFVSYSHRDAALKKEFDTILKVMQMQGIIDHWTDAEIQPGDRWNEEIVEAMERSQVILFLVSNNFLASNYIRKVEAPKAMRMMDQGKAVIVPILLRDTPGWKHEDWYCLQALPSEQKPIMHGNWRDPEEALADVEDGLRDTIKLLPDMLIKQAERWRKTRVSEGQQEQLTAMATSSRPVIADKTLPEKGRTSRLIKWPVIAICAAAIAIVGMRKGEEWATINSFDFVGKTVSGGSVSLTGDPSGGSSASCKLFAGREFKDFEAEVRYRVTELTPSDALLGVAFEFRDGDNAPQGYRVFVNGGNSTWGRGYWDGKGNWKNYPFNDFEKGRMLLAGSMNSFRLVVSGNKYWLYSNDCLLGTHEFDSAPLAGPLKLITQLTSTDPTKKGTIVFESARVRDLH